MILMKYFVQTELAGIGALALVEFCSGDKLTAFVSFCGIKFSVLLRVVRCLWLSREYVSIGL